MKCTNSHKHSWPTRLGLQLFIALLALFSQAAFSHSKVFAQPRKVAGAQDPLAGLPRRVGVIIVLGFGHPQEARPTWKMVQRVGMGVLAYKKRKARYLLMCGGYTTGHVAEAEEMKIMAMAMGVPANRILLETGSISTKQNAENAALIIKHRHFRSAILVTHRSHMDKAMKLFKKIRRLRKRVYPLYADDYQLPDYDHLGSNSLSVDLRDVDAIVVHGRTRRLDFRGDTVVIHGSTIEQLKLAAALYKRGVDVPCFMWHPAFAVGHITRAEVMGIAGLALGIPFEQIVVSSARRNPPESPGLFSTCTNRGWKKVLAILPFYRASDAENVALQYSQHGIEAIVIVANAPRKRWNKGYRKHHSQKYRKKRKQKDKNKQKKKEKRSSSERAKPHKKTRK